jgi:23S rRNA (pseudouridine1915-N3)-methyltransferase
VHLKVLAVGQRPPGWVTEAWSEFQRRLPPALGLELRELPLAPRGKNVDLERARLQEGKQLLAAAGSAGRIVALDINGSRWTTQDLASELQDWMAGGRDVYFLIGGPDGLSGECLDRAESHWSLGPLTLPHLLVRVILVEQLYRAWSILANHPYHRA